jgi:hypothetical protein
MNGYSSPSHRMRHCGAARWPSRASPGEKSSPQAAKHAVNLLTHCGQLVATIYFRQVHNPKNCGTAVEDTAKICPNCRNLAFEQTAKFELSGGQLQELAKSVSENLAKKPRGLWGVTWRVALLVFALLGIPGAIAGWNIWNSFENFAFTTTNNIEGKFRLLDQSSTLYKLSNHAGQKIYSRGIPRRAKS